MINTVIIHLVGLLLLGSGIQVLRMSHKPIHAILYLVLCFILVCIFYLVLKLEFLALIYIMVYVGAIAVLFLFVIMMLDVKNLIIIPKNFTQNAILGFFIFFCLFLSVFKLEALVDFSNLSWGQFNSFKYDKILLVNSLETKGQLSDLFLLGFWLFEVYWDLVIILGFILLTAMVGAIVLVTDLKNKNIRKYQHDGYQLNKKINESIYLISFK